MFRRFTVLILCGWAFLVAFLALGATLLANWLPTPPPSSMLLVPAVRQMLAPEPLERALFLASLVLAPPMLLTLALWGGRGHAADQRRWASGPGETGLACLIAVLLLLPLPLSLSIRAVSGTAGFSQQASLLHGLIAFSVAILLSLFVLQRSRRGWRQRRPWLILAVAVAVTAACTGLFAYRIFGFSHLSGSTNWWIHLDAVVATFAQVRSGRTLLVDAPSQYGLYPELLAPLLSLLPKGILGLTLAFAALQLVSLLSLMAVLRQRIRQPVVLVVALLALAMVTFGLHGLIGFRFGEPDPYFQYWPVRFVGPALSVPLCFWLFRRLCWRRLLLVAAFTGICLAWNLDSGIAVLYAQTMLLILLNAIALIRGRCGGWGCRSFALASFILPLTSLLVFALLLILLMLKAGQPLHWAWLTSYQTTFYGLGFMMLPLQPWPDAWYVVIAVYAMGLLLALVQLRDGRPLGQQLPLLYLSLLGAGLFSYFQGRSHFFNLVSVIWPAVLITALLSDRHLLALQQRLVPRSGLALPVAGLTALLIPSLALLGGYSKVVQRLLESPASRPDRSAAPAPQLHSELAMVRQFCRPGQPPCLILVKRQGIYALEVGTASDWRGPAPAELLLESDRQELLAAIAAGQPPRILLGLGDSSLPGLDIRPAQLLARYQPTFINPEHTLILLERRSSLLSR